jgi:lipopolysaccharide/colanic/teichoic acid biosynthesis glycosyltransferase
MPLDPVLRCKMGGVPVVEYLSFVEREIGRVDIKRIEISWLLFSEGFRFGVVHRALKRALDLVVSALLLAAASPLLLAAMIAIKLEDRGACLYRQERITRGGRRFSILKLRTMGVNAERAGAVWAARRDARITRIGRLLRRTHLDELPQLLNVLWGDMSLVGPRPERPAFVEMLARQLPLYRERHIVRAGLTGWAQINYPYGASIDDAPLQAQL